MLLYCAVNVAGFHPVMLQFHLARCSLVKIFVTCFNCECTCLPTLPIDDLVNKS